MRAHTAVVERKYQHESYDGVRLSLVLSSRLRHGARLAQVNWRTGGGGRT